NWPLTARSQNATAIADGYEPKTGLIRRPKISQRISTNEIEASVITQRGNGRRSGGSDAGAAVGLALSATSAISAPQRRRGSRARPCSACRQTPAFRGPCPDQGADA